METAKTISAEAYLKELSGSSRDNARTPMQWSSSANGGFTTGSHPWLAVNPNYTTINAAAETSDPNSVLNYTRQLIKLRAENKAFVYGDYKDLDPAHPQLFVYTRTLDGDTYLVVHNVASKPIEYTLPEHRVAGTLLLANYPGSEGSSTVPTSEAWESRIYKQ